MWRINQTIVLLCQRHSPLHVIVNCDELWCGMVWGCERLRKGRRARALSARTGGNSSLREETTMTRGSGFAEQYLPHKKKEALSNPGCPVLPSLSSSIINGPISSYINHWALYTQGPLWLVRSESVKHLSSQLQYWHLQEPGRKENKQTSITTGTQTI